MQMCASKVTRGVVSIVDLTTLVVSKTLEVKACELQLEERQVPAPAALVFPPARIRTTAVHCSFLASSGRRASVYRVGR